MTTRELREKRANLAEQAGELITRAETEKREMSAEENIAFGKFHDEIESIRKHVENVERQEGITAELRDSVGREEKRGAETPEADNEKRHASAFDAYLRNGIAELAPEQREVLRGVYVRDEEKRAAQTVTTTGGGYLIPRGFSGQLEESMKAYGGVETVCDVFSTETGNTLDWPTVDDTSNTGRLLSINTGVTETAVAYSTITFAAYKFSSDMVTVPLELLQDAAFDLNAHLASVLGTRLARVHNTYETTGTGSSQPQGIVIGASSGVSAASATTITDGELLDLVHSIDPAYRNKAVGTGWMLNDGSLKILRKLKDGDGRPLWQAGIAGGAPDTLLDFPYVINQDMAAMTTGLKPILFGAMKKFKVRKVKDVTIRRLDERYADNFQVAFLGFTRMDSHVMDAGTDPLKYITMA